jgi:hypothetical protein
MSRNPTFLNLQAAIHGPSGQQRHQCETGKRHQQRADDMHQRTGLRRCS